MTYFDRQQIEDEEMGALAHVSHFGALKVGTTTPVVEGNFPGTELDTTIWTKETSNSATLTVAQSVGSLQCGTNAAGSVKLKSKKPGQFIAGQVTVFQSGVYAGTGIANNIRRWG